jgi:hypothetical protein
MWSRPAGALLVVGITVALVTAAAAPMPPSISFELTPDVVPCRNHQHSALVTAGWHIVNNVTRATITGAVDRAGKPLPPITLATKAGKNGVVGSRKLRVVCTSTTQVLLLTAMGTGGTTTKTATLLENDG